ncbi:FmdB family transcriptional regulator [Microbacteriaceae bacterium VKM Ac-2854]|nr:FmdB family transcriptional regulator [Microbacteriaceae bacterium VKM Ac-2854]
MPVYSYRCTQCGNAFDIQQAFTDDTLTECPSCQGALRKVFSAVGVTFNGSGFYRTDSRSGSSSSVPKSDSGSGSKSEGSKSEGSKSPAAKSESKPSSPASSGSTSSGTSSN